MSGLPSPETREASVPAIFSHYVSEQKARLDRLDSFLTEALPVVLSKDAVNQRLAASGRSDLVINEPAQMQIYEDPKELLSMANNFTPKFWITTGVEKLRYEPDNPDSEYSRKIAITREQLEQMKDRPITMAEILGKEDYFGRTHADTAAFRRMLVLFPEFTIPFVLEMSNNQNRHSRYEAELFVAYQLMSRLVDINDRYVKKEDGTVNNWYLCR